jgi:tRNA A-37 threonylcarbamoyl transferase component Bud32
MEGLLNEVVRVGDTVRRRALLPMDRSFAESLLTRLSSEGFEGAPRFLGHDDEGRQILSWIEGDVRTGPCDDAVEDVFRLVRRFHDLAPDVCHNDLSPRNTVFPRERSRGPVFIDWDLAAPGRAIEDVAHACWQFLALGPDRTVDEAAPLLRRAADAYGLGAQGRAVLVDEIAAWQQRCADGIAERAAAGMAPMQALVDRGAVQDVREARAWVVAHRAALRAALG